jgi:hypothetical protein
VERACHLLLISVKPIFWSSTATRHDGLPEIHCRGFSKAVQPHTQRIKTMRSIFKAIILTSALVAGGSAFANDGGDSYFSNAISNSQLAFVAQAKTGAIVAQGTAARQVDAARVAASEGYGVVDTTNINRGPNN